MGAFFITLLYENSKGKSDPGRLRMAAFGGVVFYKSLPLEAFDIVVGTF